MKKNVFVLGLEPFNLRLLEALPHADDCQFLELFSAQEIVEVEPGFSFDALYETGLRRLKERGPVDAILNYWDFPSVCLAPLLSREIGLTAPDLGAVAVCEHKLWARQAMRECIPEITPDFCPVNPLEEGGPPAVPLSYPYWLKPVVSHSSYLGFKIEKEEDLAEALPVIRDGIAHFGDPFREFLQHVDISEERRTASTSLCIAEEIISADHQVTLEGYVWQGEIVVVGYVDSVRVGRSQSSFARYDYPSRLPSAVRRPGAYARCDGASLAAPRL